MRDRINQEGLGRDEADSDDLDKLNELYESDDSDDDDIEAPQMSANPLLASYDAPLEQSLAKPMPQDDVLEQLANF